MTSPSKPVSAPPVSLLWASQDHVADIALLHGSLFEKAWDDVAIGRLLAHPGSIALVGAAGQPRRVGAFALAQVAADEAEILSLGVAAPWQRHGVGRMLVDGVKRAAVKAGAQQLFLEVAHTNAAAIALYAKCGFAEAGRRKGYYTSGKGEAQDAVVLRLALEG